MKTILAASLLLFFPTHLAAGEVRLAVLAEGETDALSDLVVARLSSSENLVLVERAEIQRILREQQLSTALSSGSLKGRIMLGKLLRADMLLVLRAQEEGNRRGLHLTVAETNGGLRVFSASIDWGDLDKMASFVEDVWERSVRKYREGIQAVFAVPPLVSRDLTHEYDYLQTSLARLCEEHLMLAPGVLVVEFEEAHEIGKELSLPGGNAAVSRRLPFYIIGEFRNRGRGEARRVSLRFELKRGEQTVDRKLASDLQPDAVPECLRSFVTQCLHAAGSKIRDASELSLEADRLVARAGEFRRFGHLREALSLYEAALLLEPSKTDWQWDSAMLASELTRSLYDPYCSADVYRQKASEAAEVYRRSVHYLFEFLGAQDVEGSKPSNDLSRFWAATSYLRGYSQSPDDLKQLFETIEKEKQQRLIELLERKANNGTLSDRTISWAWYYTTVGRAETRRAKYDGRWRTIQLVQHLPRASQWIGHLLTYGVSTKEYKDLDYQRLLARVDALPGGGGSQPVASVRKRIEHYFAPRRPDRPTEVGRTNDKAVQPITSAQVTFEPLDLIIAGSDGQDGGRPGRIHGWLNCGTHGDMLWELKKLYAMRNKGRIEQVYRSTERFFNFINPSFDGRYAWFPVAHRRDPLIVVVDAVEGTVRQFAAADGVPPMTHSVVTAPLGPGRIFLAAAFARDLNESPDRSWCAIATLQGLDKLTLDVFYEGPSHTERQAALLSPRFCFALTPPDRKTADKVILKHSSLHYLVVDPTAKIMEFPEPIIDSHLEGYRITRHGDRIYWAGRNSDGKTQLGIWSIALPDPTERHCIQDAPSDGTVVFDGERVHLAGVKWWMAEKLGEPFREIPASIPQRGRYYYSKIFRTNNYGLVYLTSGGDSYIVRLPE